MGFSKEKIFHKFYELIVICKNLTLEIFTLNINKVVLFKYYKVDIHVKEDNSLGNSEAVLPIASSSGSLTQKILSSQTDVIKDDINKASGRNHYGQWDIDTRHV